MLSFGKAVNFVHVRRARQSSIKGICQGVIGAANRLSEVVGLLLAEPSSVVSADIVESTNIALLIAQNDQTFTRHLLHEIIAGLGELTLMPYAEPLSGKNVLLFFRENLRRNEVTL